MKVAVVTACYNTPTYWLACAHESVMKQTFPCTHILVNDGGRREDVDAFGPEAQIVHMAGPHVDGGNAARAMGGMMAVCNGFDAITYLDSDNWYEPEHIESLVVLAAMTRASVVSSGRYLYSMKDEPLGVCPEMIPDKFIDTSCMMFLPPAFGAVAYWSRVPEPMRHEGDRFVWNSILQNTRLSRAHTPLTTVNFRSQYGNHYRYFGLPVPPEAKK